MEIHFGRIAGRWLSLQATSKGKKKARRSFQLTTNKRTREKLIILIFIFPLVTIGRRSACGREKVEFVRSLSDRTGRRPANEISILKRYIFGQNQLEIRRSFYRFSFFFCFLWLIKPTNDGLVLGWMRRLCDFM